MYCTSCNYGIPDLCIVPIYLLIYLCSIDSPSVDFSFHATTVTGSDMMILLRLEQQWSTTNGNTMTTSQWPHCTKPAVCSKVIGLWFIETHESLKALYLTPCNRKPCPLFCPAVNFDVGKPFYYNLGAKFLNQALLSYHCSCAIKSQFPLKIQHTSLCAWTSCKVFNILKAELCHHNICCQGVATQGSSLTKYKQSPLRPKAGKLRMVLLTIQVNVSKWYFNGTAYHTAVNGNIILLWEISVILAVALSEDKESLFTVIHSVQLWNEQAANEEEIALQLFLSKASWVCREDNSLGGFP